MRMIYVALLRGINVGGNNKLEMSKLKATFERLGLKSVRTYINSGNIIFSDVRPASSLVPLLEKAIEKDFGFTVRVVLRDINNIAKVAKALPDAWTNGVDMKSDVMFLWENYDKPGVIKQFKINPEKEEVKYVSGAILWRVDRDYITRSSMMKLVGTDLYKNMTIRNCNTLRKLHDLMKEADKA